MEELSAIVIARHDAETRFSALATRGSTDAGLLMLDEFDALLPS